ncbi:MAG: hypothetical protein ACTSPC_12560 [Candidatus Heimdallarchaeota archaeon]
MVLNFPSKAWLLAYKDALNSDIGKAWQDRESMARSSKRLGRRFFVRN